MRTNFEDDGTGIKVLDGESKTDLRRADGLNKVMSRHRREGNREMRYSALGLGFLGLIIMGGTGYFYHAMGIAMLMVVAGYFWKIRGVHKAAIDQTEVANDLTSRRLGINRKWGRTGADRKKR